MPKSIKATKKWWNEGKGHVEAKNIVRQILKKYGWSCVEEERFPVDLHQVWPDLYESRNLRGYQMDLYATKGKGEHKQERLIQVDGGYHQEVKQIAKDKQQDEAILHVYGHIVYRFDKEDLLSGKITEQEVAEKLKL